MSNIRSLAPGVGLTLILLLGASVAGAATRAAATAPPAKAAPAAKAAPTADRSDLPGAHATTAKATRPLAPPAVKPEKSDDSEMLPLGPAGAFDDLKPGEAEEAHEWFDDIDAETRAIAGRPDGSADGIDLLAMLPGDEEGPPEGGPGRRGGLVQWMGRDAHWIDAIKLSETQKQKLRMIRERQRREAIRARADLQIATLDLRDLVRSDRPDRSAIDAQVDRIAKQRAELHKGEIAAMLEAREVLTPEQRQQLRAERERMRMRERGMREMHPRRPAGPGRSQ